LRLICRLIQCCLELTKRQLQRHKDKRRLERELNKEDLKVKKKKVERNNRKTLLKKERKNNLMRRLDKRETKQKKMISTLTGRDLFSVNTLYISRVLS